MTLESGLGHRTVPLLLAESSFSGLAKNWSSLLQLKADMTLEVRTDLLQLTPKLWGQGSQVTCRSVVSAGELLQ